VFEERPLLMFITGGTIIISLVVALIVLPFLADEAEENDPAGELKLELLEETVRQLSEQAVTPEDKEQLAPVIANYRRRIREHRHVISGKDRRKEARALHAVTFSVEYASLKRYYRSKKIRLQTYLDYLDLISTMYRRDLHGFFAHALSRLERFRWSAKRLLRPKGRTPRKKWTQEHRKNLQLIFSNNTDSVVQALDSLRGQYSEDLINLLIDERIDLTDQLIDSVYGALHRHAQFHQGHSSADDLRGYYVERRVIHQFLEQGKITEEQANAFRIDVNKLESFTLAHNRSSVVLKFMTLTGLE
jgi:CPA1 family monovalent cation:H+ antiporter